MNNKLKQLVKIGKTLKVLYVEDNESVRISTFGMLERFFANVTIAKDGKDGLQKFNESNEPFDLILTDINMPKMNGVEMIKEIRAVDSNVAILVLSAHNETNYFIETVKHGIEGYLLKPIDLKQFIDTLIVVSKKITLKRENEEYRKNLEITIDKKTEELEHSLYRDNLTDFKNRTSLLHDLETHSFSALLFIDINKFCDINRLFGIEGGNSVLKYFSLFLQAYSFNNSYEVYRLHGDCFVLRSNKDYLDIEGYEKEILKLLEEISKFSVYLEPFDKHVEINVTIGVSYEKQNALEKAELALRFAQKTKKNYAVYDRSIDTSTKLKDMCFWRDEIKNAILENQIVPFFQPIVDREQNIIKYEVLMRLQRQKEDKVEFVSPFFFLNVAKETKQYEKLTQIIIEKSFEIMKDLDVDFSINLSFEDINNCQLIKILTDLIKKHEVGHRLIFDIVESEDIDNFESVQKFVKEIKSTGVRIAIDNFGSGFSNYKRIFDIAPSFLKVDGSLIKNIVADKNSHELVKSTVFLTKALGIKTVGEHVCNREIFDMCYKIGIEEFQGYYFSEPIDEKTLLESIKVVA